MKNPLLKRLPRELISDFGKYLAVFLFMTATIGFVSGFLVADDSMLAAYQESFEKYNIEDGNFTLEKEATNSQIQDWKKKASKFIKIIMWKKMQIRIWTAKRTVRSVFTKTAIRSIWYV